MPDKPKEGETAAPQSGILPFRKAGKGLEVLLVTSSDTGRWVPPKGNIESDLSPRDSAAKEALEEAGLHGKVSKKPIGSYLYRKSEAKGGHLCRVEMFAMEVKTLDDKWPEMDLRSRCWFPLEGAATAVAEEGLRALMLDFAKSRRKK